LSEEKDITTKIGNKSFRDACVRCDNNLSGWDATRISGTDYEIKVKVPCKQYDNCLDILSEDSDSQFPPDEKISFKEAIIQDINEGSWYELGHWHHELDECGDDHKEYIWVLEKIAKYQGIKTTMLDKIKFKSYFNHYVHKHVKNHETEYDLDKIISALADAITPILKGRIPKDKIFYRNI